MVTIDIVCVGIFLRSLVWRFNSDANVNDTQKFEHPKMVIIECD